MSTYLNKEVAGQCDRCGCDLTFEQVTDGYCPDCDDPSPTVIAMED